MATWIELPGEVFINLDRVSQLVTRKLTNPAESYRVEARVDGELVPIALDLRSSEAAVKVIRALLREKHNIRTLDPQIKDEYADGL